MRGKCTHIMSVNLCRYSNYTHAFCKHKQHGCHCHKYQHITCKNCSRNINNSVLLKGKNIYIEKEPQKVISRIGGSCRKKGRF